MTMRWLRRLGRTITGRTDDRAVNDELRQHVEMETQDLIAKGVAPDEARRRALIVLGGVEAFREEARDTRGLRWLDDLRRDGAYALRSFRHSPGFTATVVLTLALGIGANAAVFQIIDAVMLRSLPVERPQELVDIRLANRFGTRGSFNTWREALTWPIWDQVREHTDSFVETFAWGTETHDLATGGEMRRATVLRVSSNAFDVLGVKPVVGRTFAPSDDRADCGADGVVINEGVWDREYGRAADVLGRTITLSGRSFSVIGVTPASFAGLAVGETFDVAVPLCAESYLRPGNTFSSSGTNWWLSFAGRLKPDWTRERATAYLAAVSPAVFRASLPPGYPTVNIEHYLAFTLTAEPLTNGVSSLRSEYTTPLMLLLGIAAIVLLATCGNIANLLLARASTREREVAVRLALGATRGRLISQAMVYSLILAVAGAALGVVVAGLFGQLLVTLLGTTGNDVVLDLQADWRLFGFAGTLALVTCVIFGIAPALKTTDAQPAFAGRGRGNSAGRRDIRIRRVLVVAQVALSLVLVVTALLFSTTLRNLMQEDLGFETKGLLVANLGFGSMHVPADRIASLRAEVMDRLRAVPGMQQVSDGIHVPLMGGYRINRGWVDGHQDAAILVQMGWVGDGYFKTLQVPVLVGREFDARERADSAPTALVNETLARRMFGDTNPVGRTFRIEATPNMPEMAYQIIGVVKDTKYRTLRDSAPPAMFTPQPQAPASSAAAQIVMRSDLPTQQFMDAVRQVVGSVSPQISVSLYRHTDRVRDLLVRERLMATLSGFFGSMAALLAMMGVYGVMSYTVASRQREIGVRLALGASRRDVLLLVVRQATMLLGAGLAMGVVIAAFAARAAGNLLFGLTPSDPLVYMTAALLLATVMAVATSVPAIRAAHVDPAQTLRGE